MDYYILGTGGKATTIAAQRVMTIKASADAPASTATVGDVIIYDGDVVAEAIGMIPSDHPEKGELFGGCVSDS